MAVASEPEISSDPDNVPPRSRLFIVVPKQADSMQIQARAGRRLVMALHGGAPRTPAPCSDAARFVLSLLQGKMSAYGDLDYCKTDLIANKGVVFCKFNKASSALVAMENINSSGTVSQIGGWSIASWRPRVGGVGRL
jgi:hypothetical protein